ncbi:winged helix-turn-helix domain-containing protein [Ensifer sp. ENS07]|uniref:ATP-binding protein n=1 Tax=unclassified Ensifer TaxID=2633371 RepID=UPI001782C798|nr:MULTISPECIES: winged helix-turn-helix domain-containing protein [unclassified Ensifer]MBD9508099.1 winged helix-turn-helix domain-containing protein [Ensifer sp. ENS10]MBD9637405.1 winged helix-turn-helix domain-containing protein [Ensifer sp. ENS07]
MPVTFGSFRIIPAERILEKDGGRIQIGSRAFDLLLALAENAGEVVSKQQLTSRAWPGISVDEVSLRVHISGLRKLLGNRPNGTPYITNISGRGYMLAGPTDCDDAVTEPVALGTAQSTVHLPPRLTRMVGRDRCLRAVADLLLETRFVSIVGVGGIGKTTVAIAAAQDLSARFVDGAFFADLAPVQDGGLVPSTIASLVGVTLPVNNEVPGLLAFLRDKRVLLVLDNAEHLIADVAALAETIFADCDGVHILTTTREALRVEGEHVYNLDGLEIPPARAARDGRDIAEYPSIQLFLDRAFASGGRRDLGPDELEIAAEICRRLDGVALAIELAAGRAAMHGVAGLRDLLDRRFGLHWQGRRTALPRHQTLTALHDWSYNLLNADEKLVLRTLGCFAGPFTIEAALAVVGDQLPVHEIIDALTQKSLVAQTFAPDGRVACRLAETTRAYCAAKLRASSEERAQLSMSHAAYYTQLLETLIAERDYFRVSGLSTVTPDLLGNVRQALESSFASGNTNVGVRLVASSTALFLERSLLVECHTWASRALDVMPSELRGSLSDALINQALAISGIIVRDAYPKVKQAFARALEIARAHGQAHLELDILAGMHIFYMRVGECYAGAEITSVAELAVSGINEGTSKALVDWLRGISLSYAGDCRAAIPWFERSLAEDAPRGLDLNLVAFTQRIRALVQYARCELMQGSASQAKKIAARAVTDANIYGHPIPRCIALAYAASAYIWKGDWSDAACLADELGLVSLQHSLTAFHAVSEGLKGELEIINGAPLLGIQRLRDALAVMTDQNHQHMVVSFSAALAEGLAKTKQYPEASLILTRAIARAEESGEMFHTTEMLGLKASIALAENCRNDAPIAEIKNAMARAREVGALALELRIALRATRMLNNESACSKELVSEIAEKLTGFSVIEDTDDLRAARAVVAHCAQ